MSKAKPEAMKETKMKETVHQKVSIPLGVTIDDMNKALKILGDIGGKGTSKEIAPIFGEKTSEHVVCGNALSAAVAFDLIEPHKRRAPYVLSSDGKKFYSGTDEQKKRILHQKFLQFSGYRKMLVALKNSKNRTMKKRIITDTWIVGADVKRRTRNAYTLTFASVGNWCRAIKDIGYSCSLTPEGEKILSQILKGEEVKPEKISVTPVSKAPPEKPTEPLPLEMNQCPICSRTDLIINEKYLDKIPTRGGTLLIFERTFQCKGCGNSITRTIKQLVESPD